MNILFILDHFQPYIGGAETLFEQLTHHYITQGHNVIVLTNNHDTSVKKHETSNHITIYRVGSGRKNRIKMIQQGMNIIQNHHIDLIHTSTYSAAFPARILSTRYQIPNQIHIHEIYGELWHQFLGLKAYCNKRFEKLIVGLLPRNRYICVSRYTLNSVRTHFNLPDTKLTLQANPIDTTFRTPLTTEQESIIKTVKIDFLSSLNETLPSQPLLGLYYGRTGKEKGLDLYIQALPEIITLYPNFHAVIIAPNQESKPTIWSKKQTAHNLQELITKLNLKQHITRISPVHSKQEIKERIIASNIVILPSRTEGFGYAMHEVAMMNKPLITTSVGGQIETLSHYNTIYWMKQVVSNEIIEGVKNLLGKR